MKSALVLPNLVLGEAIFRGAITDAIEDNFSLSIGSMLCRNVRKHFLSFVEIHSRIPTDRNFRIRELALVSKACLSRLGTGQRGAGASV